jgi:putative nucleotidyltransferase with HDIG domain
MAFLIFFLSGRSGYDLLITLAAGIGGTIAVRNRESRMGLLRAGPRLAVVLVLGVLLSGTITRVPFRELLSMSVWAAANGLITGVLSLAFLPLLEHVLNTATTFRLIELSDLNVPILKRMRLQAPGTFIHSQNVAHLSEAACDSIGADGLLARVGAYYHDIGKVDQARFFVENQTGDNRHDDLKATLSVAIIKSHVRIGMEKGRELRLPDEVLAFIEQHHGTSVIRYFYDRAVKEKGPDSAVPEDYSYAGPRPMSREAAIVMLADSAEAATRTLKKPTAAKLEKFVWDLIMDRFQTGELNNCDLTLRDLESVKESFVHVLTGHFHSRIEYPRENANGR